MKHKAILPLFFLFFGIVASSCIEEGSAYFNADLKEDNCLNDFFPFEPTFRAARKRGGTSGIFLQTEGGNIQNTDLMVFEIFDTSQLDEVILEKTGSDSVAAVGQIELGDSCKGQHFGYYLEGELSFQEFDTNHNGRVKGTLTKGVIKNSKTDAVVGTNLEGEFDFPVFGGQPFEEFTTN